MLLCKYLLWRKNIYIINKGIYLFEAKCCKSIVVAKVFFKFIRLETLIIPEKYTVDWKPYHHFSSQVSLKAVNVDSKNFLFPICFSTNIYNVGKYGDDKISCDHFLQERTSKFLKTKTVTQKLFWQISFIQNVYHPEKAYTSASKLLLLFATKYPKKLLLRADLL